jgi:hypothetical protein
MEKHLQWRTLFVFILVAMTFSVLFDSAARCQSAGKLLPSSGVTLSYSAPTRQLTLHEPVIITFRVVNQTSLPINLDLGQDRKWGFLFAITKPDGVKLDFPAIIHEGIAIPGEVSVKSGDTLTQDLLINEWYDFPLPGKYVLQGRLAKPIAINNGSRYETDPGFRAELEIGPSDELTLAKTCEALTNQIEASNSFEQAADAARTLSYIEDPIAVPYLRRALFSGRLVQPIAINALEKIANEAAVRVLIESLKVESVGDDRLLARYALVRIQKKTTDENLQREIDRALAGDP